MDSSQVITLIPRYLIRLYQKVTSGMPRRCRFYPTCSNYALEALEARGLWSGLWHATLRISKCHPWHSGGFDPFSF